jgi:hypothetical protein
MATFSNGFFTENEECYECKICNTKCSRKSEYDRHLLTRKHKNGEKSTDSCEKSTFSNAIKYVCHCKKAYCDRSGLWRHKQKCSQVIVGEISPDHINIDKEMFMMLLQQNNELQRQILDIVKDGKTINNNITNNNNQSFNMNFFLNEQCKDALNISEFVNTLPLTLEDLENTGKVGYVKGITDIVVRGLKEMDVHKRPIHCSDLKREVMYVKDNDVWHKDEDNVKVKKAIQNIGTRNYRQVKEWIEKHPEAKDINTKKHEQYVQIRLKCTGGIDKEEDDKIHSKILSNIAKVIHINK